MTLTRFQLYTFQLRPNIGQQYSIMDKAYSATQLMEKKNQLFYQACVDNLPIYHRGNNLRYIIIYNDPSFILLRIANQKKVQLEVDWRRASIESQPSCLVAINNDPNIQSIAIEIDRASFGSSKTVAKILQKTLDSALIDLGLRVSVMQQTEVSAFWNLVSKHNAEIQKIRFEFAYPNLPPVNKYLQEELKESSKLLASKKTTLEYDSERDDVLKNIVPSNEPLNNLVNASAGGAGPIKVKAKNVRFFESTADSFVTFTADELSIEADENVIDEFVKYLKQKTKRGQDI